MRVFEDFVLGLPYLVMRRAPYAWVGIVALWTWPPYFSGLFMLLFLIGVGLMLFQQIAWERKIQREHTVLFKDHPQAPLYYRLRNSVLLLAACALLGWWFDGRFNLNAFQWAVLLAGIMASYEDHVLFGRGVVYLITDKGIAIRYVSGHIDNRLFFGYEEIRHITHLRDMSKRERRWSILAPVRENLKHGLLLTPNNPEGFSKVFYRVFLTPTDEEKFLQAIPMSFMASKPEPAWDLTAEQPTA